ncbi:Ethylene receptor [Heracleum sosnowskyi]|uniref:Ethylene receptor n=1 Tax=Heracleum sosnowskyi TaxID=360622 RepID=A0AAD8H8U4_9APIA|nr:Ethylene receptor [Heracleum sosnowskyi]
MLKRIVSKLLILWFLFSVTAAGKDFSDCNCDEEEGWWSVERIMEFQKVSDFLIAAAYFSIPIELLYFISCSSVPFKWVIVEFILFIVLCGMTHFLNGCTYSQHTFQLMFALTIFKFLTALVSFATAITLVTLIPLLLKVKFRESVLIKKTWDLGREVGIIKKQKEAGWHVRMLTQEIRKSLDRHTILYTTLDKLSETLDLQNCVIWMPNESRTEMNLTHELNGGHMSVLYNLSIPTTDFDVRRIKGNDGVNILDPQSSLAVRSSRGTAEHGTVAAIRIPMLRVCDFKAGTPEIIQACYAILVLVLPSGQLRCWGNQEIEILNAVADQVAVALSHAAVLEESQLVREKLAEQNRALQQAKQDAMMATHARNSFQTVVSNGLRRPMHSIMGLLSVMQDENLSNEQQTLVNTMATTSNVLSVLINDVMDTSPKDNAIFPFEMRHFSLHSMVKEAACLAKCLCGQKNYLFAIEVEKSLPDYVMGDERRFFQVILHMVGNLLKGSNAWGCLSIRVYPETGGSLGRNDQQWGTWRTNSSDGHVYVKFEIGINNNGTQIEGSRNERYQHMGIEEGLSFNVCRKLVQMMQGNIWVDPNPVGFDQSMALLLPFHLRPSIAVSSVDTGEPSERPDSNSLFRGLQVLLADHDDVNLAVTRKLLEKLGCVVSIVSTGYECLGLLGPSASPFQIILLDLHMSDLDGYEIALRIRRFRKPDWPLIIAMSASDTKDVWEKCLQVGINGLVQKPVLLGGIADELSRVLFEASNIL